MAFIDKINPDVHSHQFRHSMATHLIDDGVNVFNVSKILGHQSVATTMKIHWHYTKDDRKGNQSD